MVMHLAAKLFIETWLMSIWLRCTCSDKNEISGENKVNYWVSWGIQEVFANVEGHIS